MFVAWNSHGLTTWTCTGQRLCWIPCKKVFSEIIEPDAYFRYVDDTSTKFQNEYQETLFSEMTKRDVYFRYVDNTFTLFQNTKESKEYLIKLNGIHRSLKFTSEKEQMSPFS